MRAVFRGRPDIKQKSPELAGAIDELVTAINTAPTVVGDRHIHAGAGTPEGKVVGSIGDLYLRSDGSTSTTLYVKTSGLFTATGWTGK